VFSMSDFGSRARAGEDLGAARDAPVEAGRQFCRDQLVA
jgi:hypothetical protein